MYSFKRQYRGPIQAVILDWAGTVIDHGSRAPVLAVIKSFEQAGVPISIAQARGPMGKAKKEHIQAVLELPEVAAHWLNVHKKEPDDRDVEDLYERFLPLQKDILPECAELIPGCIDAIAYCRAGGIKVGSTTGYTRELMDILQPLAAEQGYCPDVSLCASDVTPGRPAPWMCLQVARMLDVYPMDSVVKVDDTCVGIEAGLNAGMWTVGIAATGNLVGLSRLEMDRLDPQKRKYLVENATAQLLHSGADFVIPSVAELPATIEKINDRLAAR